ncbi:hypothetical protein [Pantoea sp. GD03673]|nr:hypothetical protein [Pantoea sp. GD03673]MDH2067454.1 hypothetical protein [Pantoea sp. GD03673]
MAESPCISRRPEQTAHYRPSPCTQAHQVMFCNPVRHTISLPDLV